MTPFNWRTIGAVFVSKMAAEGEVRQFSLPTPWRGRMNWRNAPPPRSRIGAVIAQNWRITPQVLA